MTTDEHPIAWWEYEYDDTRFGGDKGWWSGMGRLGEGAARHRAATMDTCTGRYRPVYAVPGEPRDVKEERNA